MGSSGTTVKSKIAAGTQSFCLVWELMFDWRSRVVGETAIFYWVDFETLFFFMWCGLREAHVLLSKEGYWVISLFLERSMLSNIDHWILPNVRVVWKTCLDCDILKGLHVCLNSFSHLFFHIHVDWASPTLALCWWWEDEMVNKLGKVLATYSPLKEADIN